LLNEPEAEGPRPTFREAFRFWLTLGFINFGGPAGQIALMHRELVDRRRWIAEKPFLHALNYCMLLPGPEAQQLAIYVGWLLNGTRGGLVAGILFIAPAFFLMLGLSWAYAVHGDVAWVSGLFGGLRAGVVAIVAAAVVRIAGRALTGTFARLIAAAAFVALFAFEAPFPLVVGVAGAIGWARARADRTPPAALPPSIDAVRVPVRRTLSVLALGLAAWWLPLLAVAAVFGADHVLTREAFFFSKAAMVTFGGAYAVLAYIDQAAVNEYGWIEPGHMLDGLGLAETTPGPLIMVTEFVGYLGAFRNPGAMPPEAAGALGAAVTVWATFAPCFLWIFLGAPYIEALRGRRVLDGALSAITAAVVGVILNLGVGLAVHTFFRDGRVDLFALALAAIAFVGLTRGRWPDALVVAGTALAGIARGLVFR
jgi:chromate transporter